MKLLALMDDRLSPPEKFLVLTSVTGCVESRAIMWLEILGKIGKSNNLIGRYI
jgi:hypothetical protein